MSDRNITHARQFALDALETLEAERGEHSDAFMVGLLSSALQLVVTYLGEAA